MSFSSIKMSCKTRNKFTVILILFVTCCSNSTQAILRGHCTELNGKLLIRICVAVYPKEIKERYLDGYIEPKTPYTVFSVNNGDNQYFIAHGKSELLNCSENVKINDVNNFNCDGHMIELKNAFLACLHHRASVADELIDNCAATSNTATRFVAMHYNVSLLHTSSSSMDNKLNLKLYFVHMLWLLKSYLILCSINI